MKRFSERVEFWVIVVIAYGYPVIGGLWSFVTKRAENAVHYTDADLWPAVIYELVAGALVLLLLRARGIPFYEMKPLVAWTDLPKSVFVFMAAVAASWFSYAIVLATPSAEERFGAVTFTGAIGLPLVLLTCVLNTLFENGILLGYVQERLRSQGMAIAVGGSLLLRILGNVEQGLFAVVGVAPIGLVFGIYVWRTGRVGPVLIAQAVLDALGLLSLDS